MLNFTFFIFIFILVNSLLTFIFGICPSNTISWNSECYLFFNNSTGFADAELSCKQTGGHLTSIHDGFANALLAQEANKLFHDSTETDFWIGLNTLMSLGGNWTWTDETVFDFYDWKKCEPQNITGANCATLSLTDGLWSAQDCFQPKPFVCGISEKFDPTFPTFYNCTDGWIYFQPTHSCYGKPFNTSFFNLNWTMAENYCENLGAHLPAVHSFEEFRLIENYVYLELNSVFTGIFTVNSGRNWQTTNGSPADFLNFAPWCNGSPTNKTGESYVSIAYIDENDCYNNDDCSNHVLQIICKKAL